MPPCIYCGEESVVNFRGKEHVIPQSFGKFSDETPTLESVCDGCNIYFSKELDLPLARDTLEGVTRYEKGVVSRGDQFAKSIEFSLDNSPENGEYAGAITGGVDPKTGKRLPLVPQFWIRNIHTKAWERYRMDQIKNITLSSEEHGEQGSGRETRVMGPSKESYEAVIAELHRCGIPYKEGEMLGQPPFLKNISEDGKVIVRGHVSGELKKHHMRAFAKILFNFATHNIGETETLKPEWDKARRYVRWDGTTLLHRITDEPFWGEESENARFEDNGYNLRIANKNGNVVGVAQFNNLFTYEFVLVERYQLPADEEVACRFVPKEKPSRGVKKTIKPMHEPFYRKVHRDTQ